MSFLQYVNYMSNNIQPMLTCEVAKEEYEIEG